MKSLLSMMAGLLLAGTITTNAQQINQATQPELEKRFDQINDTSVTPIWMSTQAWQQAMGASLAVYPNPSSGLFTVKLQEQISVSEVSIFDLTGREILQKKGNNAVGASGTTIDLSAYHSGMYLLVLRNGTDTYVHRLVKY